MITDIRLQSFRSYKDDAFEFDNAVNIIVGPNASGKTNLLEALLVLIVGKSYRAGNEELIKTGKSWARLEGHSLGSTRVVKLNREQLPAKTFDIDKKVYKRLPADKTLPVVLFEPQHLLILTGRPELRRDYLDDLLEQLQPGYGRTRRDYKRAVAQRNALLKKGQKDGTFGHQQLFAWNVRLSELGGQIVVARRQLVEDLNKDFADIYKNLSAGKKSVELNYVSPITSKNYVSSLLHQLEKNTELDFLRGFTSLGPHREDLAVSIDGQPVQDTASRGEVRTLVLALKVLELAILEKVRDHKPIILLDDVFSELDGARRQALTRYLKNYQTFITTTDADIILHHFTKDSNVIALG